MVASAQPCGCDLGCKPAHFCAQHKDTPSPDWYGVDLDGVLVEWDPRYLPGLGPPIPLGLALVRQLLAEGKAVRIFTARVQPSPEEPAWWAEAGRLGFRSVDAWVAWQEDRITHFCLDHFGVALPITAAKDWKMVTCYDDRCVQMIPNTGLPAVV
jgi:hypothetical protein